MKSSQVAQFLQKFVFFGLCLLIVIAPIPLGGNRVWAQSLLEIFIFALAILQTTLVFFEGTTAIWRPRCAWLLPLWLLLIWIGLQSSIVTQPDLGALQLSFFKTLMYAVWAHLLCIHLNDANRVKQFGAAIVTAGTLQAFYGISLQLLHLDVSPVIGMDEGDRARGSFVYQNHFANFLALTICTGLGLLLAELSSRKSQRTWRQTWMLLVDTLLSKKLILRLCLVLMVIGLVMSHSRMGNAAFFTSLFVVGIAAAFGLYKRPPTLLKPILLSVLILDMLVIGSMFGIEKLQQRYQETSFSSESRDEVDVDGFKLVELHGLTGTGAGSFYGVFPNVQTHVYHGFYDHAHNDYLQFAIELGVPVTLLLLGWLIILALKTLQTMRSHEEKVARGISFAVLMGMVHMGIHCTVDFNLQAPANALLFIALLALSISAPELPQPTRHSRYRP